MTDPTTLNLKYPTPASTLSIERDLPFAGGTYDVYRPHDPSGVVILALGYADAGAKTIFGKSFKHWASFDGWARLIAAHGLAAVTYTNTSPLEDLKTLVQTLRATYERVGLWSCSGHAPTALGALDLVDAAALLYPATFDIEGSGIADMAALYRFATPVTRIEDVPATPLFVVRAGADTTPGLNAALDRFVPAALARDLPLTLVNAPGLPHAFDLLVDARPPIHALLSWLSRALS